MNLSSAMSLHLRVLGSRHGPLHVRSGQERVIFDSGGELLSGRVLARVHVDDPGLVILERYRYLRDSSRLRRDAVEAAGVAYPCAFFRVLILALQDDNVDEWLIVLHGAEVTLPAGRD